MKMGGRRSATTTKVFVGSLPPNVTTDDLRRLFAPYGAIAECDIANRCGFLHLEDKDLAEKAIEDLNNSTFMGGRISVEKGRVKPPGRKPGPMRGAGNKDRVGPYNRDRPPRNGGYERSYGMYGAEGFEFDKGYEAYGERRPPFDDRRGFSSERRPPGPNAYGERPRPAYGESRPGYDTARGGYDERRVPPGPGEYDDRRMGMGDRRAPLPDQQSLSMGGTPRPLLSSYERNADMYSRRDNGPKPLMTSGATGYERAAGYSLASLPPSYPSAATGVAAGYTSTNAAGYGATSVAGAANNGSYADARASYGERAPLAATSMPSYADARGTVATGYPVNNPGYESVGGGYGDSYGQAAARGGAYDTSYPPLPQRGGFASGVNNAGGGSGPRRDIPPARRY